MRGYNLFLAFVLIFVLLGAGLAAQRSGQASSARQAVDQFFSLLKTQQYAKLYDLLPGQLQQQLTREQLAVSLKRLDEFLVIEKLQLGRVQEKGEYAVVDTTVYGRLKQPLKFNEQEIHEGRVSAQQYLFKENGQWKVVTADERTRAFFLKRNPQFNQQFQLSRAQFAFKQNGQWQPINPRQAASPH
jgi:hypothetical protein